jgi:hypothetical protein
MKGPSLAAIAALSLSLSVGAVTSAAAADTGVSAKASVDRRSALVGDRITLTVEVKAPKSAEVVFPDYRDYRIGDFEIKDSSLSVKGRITGGKVYRQRYIVAVYSTGKVTIPEVSVKWRAGPGRGWSVLKTKPVDITIKSVLPADGKAADIRPIKGPLTFRNPYSGIIALAAALIVILAAAIFIYRRFKGYKPVRLPHETALEELESIRAAYLQGGPITDFYVGVSDCVRRYIERAFSLRAPEMTTEEFLSSLKDSSELKAEQKELLGGFMAACDLVKFAKYSPTRDEAESVFTTASDFIMRSSGAYVEETASPLPGSTEGAQ